MEKTAVNQSESCIAGLGAAHPADPIWLERYHPIHWRQDTAG